MSKHTPGPWRWAWPEGPNGLPQLEGDVEYSEMNPVLMVAYGCQPKCIDRGCPLLPRKADRDLIAASPDLLKAGKTLMDSRTREPFSVEKIVHMMEAIAKAEEGP